MPIANIAFSPRKTWSSFENGTAKTWSSFENANRQYCILSWMKKLMIIFKRWTSFPRVAPSYSNLSSGPELFHDVHHWDEGTAPDFTEERPSKLVHADRDYKEEEAPEGSKAVYVGNSRRRYFISAEYLTHPLLAVLTVDKFRDGFSVASEVVLFEHLVWILENSDPDHLIQTDSTLKELAEFYICN